MERIDIYFASLVAMTLHPGYLKPDTLTPSLEQCLELAKKMEALQWQLQPQQ